MQTHLTKWGNSLGVRIPRAYLQSLELHEGSVIEIEIEDNHLVLKKGYSLEDLLSGITPDNLHNEIDTGAPVGCEVW